MININLYDSHRGFSLIETMMVITIVGILAMIVIPNYQRYVVKTQRTAMMSELQNMANQLSSKQLIHGHHAYIDIENILGSGLANSPSATPVLEGGVLTQPVDQSNAIDELYEIAISPVKFNKDHYQLSSAQWQLTATPITDSSMADDGVLSLDYQNIKCRNEQCGYDDNWR